MYKEFTFFRLYKYIFSINLETDNSIIFYAFNFDERFAVYIILYQKRTAQFRQGTDALCLNSNFLVYTHTRYV